MIRKQHKPLLALVLSAAALLPGLSHAQAQARTDLLNLTASASTEVTRDLLMLSFSTTREGKEAAAVQSELKQALDAALAEARKVAKPGQVEVQAGNLSIYPRYGQPRVSSGGATTNQITGWQGSVELQVQGRDMDAIAKLSSRIQTMSIANVSYGLSREAREKAEDSVVADAIAGYKAKAANYAKQFGYSAFRIGEVSVNADPGPVMAMAQPRFKAMGVSASEQALPVESGKATVTVNVNGNVVMTR
ncbi:SIMPL domain-containing protein [Roseateles amylovorans]|uniref:SIMPL domain-containing protein n=1 Tax=Roseateles amylovorans TaxID=2978473 RepID=A0ABY6B5F3_9BURK|nr:SIMPL domain-containing protein [Roseateles amylovorans]UXH79976.1 SIMPL domain-containing protein [Roseateles amylovorans]